MGKPALSRALLAAAFATASVACTLLTGASDLTSAPEPDSDAGPLAPDGSNAADASSVLGDVDATTVDACGTSSCEVLPDGFQLVALGAVDVPCPSGFTQPFDAVEQPSLDPGACTCGCNVTQQPACNVGGGNTISLLYGAAGSGTCPSMGQDVPTGCSTAGFLGPFIAYERQYVAPSATLAGGACNASATKDDTKLKTLRVRVCQASVIPQCDGKICPPSPAPFASCVAASGALACPAAWPQRHVVGASASFTCGAGCTCAVAGQCNATGTLSYFASGNCSGTAELTYPVNGACNATGGSNVAYASHRYDPAPPTNVRCQSTGASTPSPALAQETTICCK